MSATTNRRQKDITKLMMKDYKVEMETDDSKKFFVYLHGPKESLYEGGVWKLRVELPDEYPFKSPSIYFVNNIFHPNVDDESGEICVNVFHEDWSPMIDLLSVFENYITQFLLTPNPLNPLNEEAAELMITDHSAYEQKVKEHCQKYAKPADVGVSGDKKLSKEESDRNDEH
ncbi:unnamed protein product [Musa acuminata var. zebrina]